MADVMRPMIQHKRKQHFIKDYNPIHRKAICPLFFFLPPISLHKQTLMLKYDFIIICPVMELTYMEGIKKLAVRSW